MNQLVLIFGIHSDATLIELIPLFGMLTGIIIPIAVFVWLYYDAKNKRATILEISKNLEDNSKLDQLLTIFDERKKQPIDYRRSGVISIFVGLGLYFLGWFALGRVLEGVGALVGLIGIGQLIAGYLYPNTGSELTDAVDNFEKK
tara:strand:+ start:723 stop:1157 length:435 start_codon:yes stop_codon:yes gene_type:complete